MVSFEEWQGRMAAIPDHRDNDRAYPRRRFPAVVVGVLPPEFHPLEAFFASGERPGYYFPLAPELVAEDRGWERWYVLGRLRTAVSIDQARRGGGSTAADVSREFPEGVGCASAMGRPIGLG